MTTSQPFFVPSDHDRAERLATHATALHLFTSGMDARDEHDADSPWSVSALDEFTIVDGVAPGGIEGFAAAVKADARADATQNVLRACSGADASPVAQMHDAVQMREAVRVAFTPTAVHQVLHTDDLDDLDDLVMPTLRGALTRMPTPAGRRSPTPSTTASVLPTSDPRLARVRRSSGTQLTERDVAHLEAMIAVRAVTIPMLHQYGFPDASSSTTVNNWLKRMRGLDLVATLDHRTRAGRVVVVPTRRAYALVGGAGRPRPVAPSQLVHVLSVAEIALQYRRADVVVVADHTITVDIAAARAAAARNANANADAKKAPAGRTWIRVRNDTATHAPDLVATRGNERVLVEVELNSKNQRSYDEILLGAARAVAAGQFTGVRYLLRPTDRATELKVRRAAARVFGGASSDLFTAALLRPVPPIDTWLTVETYEATWDKPYRPA